MSPDDVVGQTSSAGINYQNPNNRSSTSHEIIPSDFYCQICGLKRKLGDLFCGEGGVNFNVTDLHS